MHHHGPPPWIDGADVFLPLLSALFPLLLLMWVLSRWFLLDALAARGRDAPAVQRDTVRPRWDAAVARYAETARAYAAFECDPAAVLHRPALADVGEPATARFVDAFAEATALLTDAYPGPQMAERFVAAAERADRAWKAAVDAADRVRAARFAPGERALLEQTLVAARAGAVEPARGRAPQRVRAGAPPARGPGAPHRLGAAPSRRRTARRAGPRRARGRLTRRSVEGRKDLFLAPFSGARAVPTRVAEGPDLGSLIVLRSQLLDIFPSPIPIARSPALADRVRLRFRRSCAGERKWS